MLFIKAEVDRVIAMWGNTKTYCK